MSTMNCDALPQPLHRGTGARRHHLLSLRDRTEVSTVLDLLDSLGADPLGVSDLAERRVLELACGSGRLTLPIASAGHRVLATDVEPEVLAYLGSQLDLGSERSASSSRKRPMGLRRWLRSQTLEPGVVEGLAPDLGALPLPTPDSRISRRASSAVYESSAPDAAASYASPASGPRAGQYLRPNHRLDPLSPEPAEPGPGTGRQASWNPTPAAGSGAGLPGGAPGSSSVGLETESGWLGAPGSSSVGSGVGRSSQFVESDWEAGWQGGSGSSWSAGSAGSPDSPSGSPSAGLAPEPGRHMRRGRHVAPDPDPLSTHPQAGAPSSWGESVDVSGSTPQGGAHLPLPSAGLGRTRPGALDRIGLGLADMTAFCLTERFKAVCLPNSSITLLSPVTRRHTLRLAASHLAPGGILIVCTEYVLEDAPVSLSLSFGQDVKLEEQTDGRRRRLWLSWGPERYASDLFVVPPAWVVEALSGLGLTVIYQHSRPDSAVPGRANAVIAAVKRP
ncbi:class I SAM-dependent methyltransferase [uncultured Actinomyces sp.]|uniref:class I SAM-dependent methyltransferase n=1 Tax=uncultured Actinomyces sp. TaxID=249061 RepID=UPI0028DAF93D|nr:class I SAM-dependent methyltransferase [uncultured Actinomyces sp.]